MNARRRARSAVLLGLAWCSAAAAHAGWERTLVAAGDSASASVGRFTFDGPVFAHTRPDYADVRVVTDRDRTLGLRIGEAGRSEAYCREREVPMKRLSLKVMGDTSFEAVFQAEDPALIPTRVRVATGARDFEMALSIRTASSAGAPEEEWIARLTRFPLFDYARFLDLRQETASWVSGGHRALRLRVDGLTQSQRSLISTLSGSIGNPGSETFQVERRLLRLESIAFSAEDCTLMRTGSVIDTLPIPSSGPLRPHRDPKEKRTWFVFAPGRIPLRALLLDVGPGSFMRRAIVAGRPDSLPDAAHPQAEPWTWPRLAETGIHRIDWGGAADSSLRIPFSGPVRPAFLALGVVDNDDPPISLVGLRGEAPRMEARFPIRPGETYRVRYGRAGDSTPVRSDFADMLGRFPETPSAAFVLGPPRPLEPEGGPPARSGTVSGNVLLMAGLGLAIATLFVLLVVVARKAGKQEV